MSRDYYLLNDAGETTGPYKVDQLAAMWVEGRISFDALHWSEGMEEWKPLRLIAPDIHAARRQSAPGTVKKSPTPLVTAKASDPSVWVQQPVEKKPLVNSSFLLNSTILVFVMALMAYFISPNLRANVNEVVHQEYETYFPTAPEKPPEPQPLVITPRPAPPEPVAPVVPLAPPEPPQKYSLDEIKKAIQGNLVTGGVIESAATCEWQRLEYTDDTDVRYEVIAHLPGGATKFCTGMVALNPKKHEITLSSRLSD